MTVTGVGPAGPRRPYLVYVASQTLSGFGGVMAAVSVVYLLVSESNSQTVYVSIATALQYLPMLVLRGPASRIVDRHQRLPILLTTQSTLALGSLLAGTALLLGIPTIGTLIVYSAVMGIVQVVDLSARQIFFSDLLGPDGLRRGLASYNAVFGVGRLIAPIVGGILIATVGAAAVFLVNAGSFGIMIAGLLAIRRQVPHLGGRRNGVPESSGPQEPLPPRRRYLPLLVMVVLVGALGYQFAATNTIFTQDVFDANAAAYGVLGGALAAGGIIGNIAVARLPRDLTSTEILLVACLFGVLETACSAAPNIVVYGALLIPVGISLTSFTSSALVYLQNVAGERKAALVTAYNSCYIGVVPLGLLVLGVFNSILGPRSVLAIPGVTIIIGFVLLTAWARRANSPTSALAVD